MKPNIDPMVDCVFKAILGAVEHSPLLINFLNAVLVPRGRNPVVAVDILNPYNDKEYLQDKLSIVDIKARDQAGETYQIEVQVALVPGLPGRMLFTWSDIYQSQMKEGDDYSKIKPVVSIWILGENLPNLAKPRGRGKDAGPKPEAYHHCFTVYDKDNQVQLNDHLNIHVLELRKWNLSPTNWADEDRWLYFFREGENLDIDAPPAILQTREMEEAMKVLRQFSEKEKDYALYQARRHQITQELTNQRTFERLEQAKAQAEWEREQALLREQQAQLREEQATREKDQIAREKDQVAREKDQAELREKQAIEKMNQLMELLKQAGINPDRS